MTVNIETIPGVPPAPGGTSSNAGAGRSVAAPGIVGDWLVNIRDANRERVAEVDDYATASFVQRFNDVGTWSIDVPLFEDDGETLTAVASALLTDGAGIVLVRGSTTVFSGPLNSRRRIHDAKSDRLVCGGFDDMIHLRDRLVSPQPASSAPPYNVSAYDTRTGTCSTILRQYVDVNAGPSAIASRRVSGLTLAADPTVGSSVSGQGRWQNLLALLQELAVTGGDLGFQVVQSSSSTDLVFSVYSPVDRTGSVIFSNELETMGDHEYEETAPEVTYVFAGGGGEGTARTIVEGADSTAQTRWKRRIEAFRDRRDTTDATQLNGSITEELAQHATRTQLRFTPFDQTQMAYLSNYQLGDKATFVIDGVSGSNVIREVDVTFEAEKAVKVEARVGTPGAADVEALVRSLRFARKRIQDLERR